MSHYIIKTRNNCQWCEKAKALMDDVGIAYEVQHHETDADFAGFRAAGFKTFPQIFCDGRQIGGYSDLVAHLLFAT